MRRTGFWFVMRGWGFDCGVCAALPHRACLLPLQRHYSHGLLLAGAGPPPGEGGLVQLFFGVGDNLYKALWFLSPLPLGEG